MATKKSSAKKAGAVKSAGVAASKTGAMPPYGLAIRDTIARGDAREMKQVAASTRKYLSDIQAALTKLDAAMGKLKG